MKASIVVGKVRFEVDGADQKDIARQIASLQEVFGETACGVCGVEDIMWRVREVGGDEYFENVCRDPKCQATLSFGQGKAKKGTLFPIRKITKDGKASRKEGTYDKVHGGWKKWMGKTPEVDDEE